MTMNGPLEFENGKALLLGGHLSDAKKSFALAKRRDEDPAFVNAYRFYAELLDNDYKFLFKTFSKGFTPSGFSYYSYYWFLLMYGKESEIQKTLSEMLHSDNYFVRVFALKEFVKSKKVRDGSAALKKLGNRFSFSREMRIEADRAEFYRELISGRFHLAELQIRTLVKKYPKFSDLYVDYLELYRFAGRTELTRKFLQKESLISAAENDFRLMFLLSREFYLLGDFEKSADYLQILCHVFQNNPVFFTNLGNAFLKCGEEKLAEKAYREAVSLDEDSFSACFNLGTLLFCQGNTKESAEMLIKAVEIQRNKPALENLILSLCRLKRFEEALHYLRILEAEDEGNGKAKKIRERMRQNLIRA